MNVKKAQKIISKAIQSNASSVDLSHYSDMPSNIFSSELVELLPSLLKLRHTLEALYLEGNNLDNIPEDFSLLSNLKILNLNNNNFQNFPKALCNLYKLRELYLNEHWSIGVARMFSFSGNLKNNEITLIPKEINSLKDLEILDMRRNKLIDISHLKKLPNLKELYLAGNKELEKIIPSHILSNHSNPSSIINYFLTFQIINNLKDDRNTKESVNLENLGLLEIPKEILEFASLRSLNLRNNSLKTIHSKIYFFKNLKQLDLRGNLDLEKVIPPDILNDINNPLRILSYYRAYLEIVSWQKENNINKSLNFNDFGLTELPRNISDLKTLQSLYLRNNRLKSLPKELSNLLNLQYLDIGYNYLNEVPNDLAHLSNLQYLAINNNQLKKLPDEICKLTSLRHLHLEENNLRELPKEMKELKNLQALYLNKNKGLEEKIPIEILSIFHNPQKILNYYYAVIEGGVRPLNEAKIVVVGEADFGKTLLIRRLIYNDYIDTTSTTGIKIENLNALINGEKVKLNVWDFGGQEIMHSTHQFFFTNRTIYILVVDARQNEDKNQTEEWLKRIESFGGNSPIIIVGSHIDQNQRDSSQKGQGYFDISRRELQEKFKNIKGFFGVCSDVREKKYDTLFEEFTKGLFSELSKLDDIHKPFPLDWFSVKEELESMSKNNIPYITDHDYLAKCFDKNVKDEISKNTIREFLNEAGTIIYFKDLPERMVFNPEWITKGVYALVDNTDIIDNKGELEISYMTKALNAKDYKPDEHRYILQLMRKFNLCVDIEQDKRFLIPDLLMKTAEPDDIGNWGNSLNFQYHYETYLKNIFTQFVVKMYPLIYQKNWWRNGVILEREGSKALVNFYASERKVVIKITGENIKKRQALLSIIRNEFDEIHNKFQSLGITQWVAHSTKIYLDRDGKEKEILKDYEELVAMEEIGEKEVFVKELRQKLSITEWLDGVETKIERRNKLMSENQPKYSFPNAKQVTIIEKAQEKIEISYQENTASLANLENHLNSLSSKMNESQKQMMEDIANEIISKLEKNISKSDKSGIVEIEDSKKGKWETKLKTVIPIIPKVPGFDTLPSVMIETTRTIEPNEFISTVRNWLYGNNKTLSILETEKNEDSPLSLLRE